MIVEIENKIVKQGEIVEVPFLISSFAAYEAFQTTLEFDKDRINILEIIASSGSDFGSTNYSMDRLQEGLIPMSWNGLMTQPELFKIRIEVKENCQVEDMFSFNSKVSNSEAYLKKNLISAPIELRAKMAQLRILQWIRTYRIHGLEIPRFYILRQVMAM